MFKATLAAILLLVLADFAIDRGAQTQRVIGLLGSGAHWVAHMGDGSIFGK
jgi:hypothetical protein